MPSRNTQGGTMADDQTKASDGKGRWFTTTSWTNLDAARRTGSPEAKEALERLCTTYWYPLYAYIRRSGRSSQDAEDLTQAFFFQLLEKNYLGAVDRKKGKFRSFLLSALNHFLANEHDFRNAAKRGGGKTIISLDAEDRYLLEPGSDVSPETIFENRWAGTVMNQARTRLQENYEQENKGALFNALKPYLEGEPSSGDYDPVAEELGMTAGAVAVAVHRLRKRFGDMVKEEISRTVANPAEVEAEMRHLHSILQSSRE